MTNFPHYGHSGYEYAPHNPAATRQLSLRFLLGLLVLASIGIGALLGNIAASPHYATTSIALYGVLMFCLLAWATVTGYEDWFNDPMTMLVNTRRECRMQWIMSLLLVVGLTFGYSLI